MIEEKEQYTFEELCEGLEISMSAFCKRANVDEGTVARIRKGHLGRIGTINRLLRTFSEIYGRKFTLDNVTGLKKVEKPIAPIDVSVPVQPKQETMPSDMVETTSPLLPSTIANSGIPAQTDGRTKNEGAKGRTWKQPKKKEDYLPEGCILYSDFAKQHGVPPTTFRDHFKIGLGKGMIHGPNVPEDGSVLVKDYVRVESRPKPGREKETEYYLTSEQQAAAIQFWKRHDVNFTECDQAECPCHQKGE